MNLNKFIATTLNEYLSNLVLFRGVEKENYKPTDYDYSFFFR